MLRIRTGVKGEFPKMIASTTRKVRQPVNILKKLFLFGGHGCCAGSVVSMACVLAT